jgi:murein DD-endopeptidase MepM/ murein hydrolase activator NlpD
MPNTDRASGLLQVESLDCRVVPAAQWPFAADVPSEVIGTWGQYQDISAGATKQNPGFDANIHMHEGIDIKARRDTVVRAVASGKIHGVIPSGNKGDGGYGNSVSIRDDDGGGWNYKHIVLDPGLETLTLPLQA